MRTGTRTYREFCLFLSFFLGWVAIFNRRLGDVDNKFYKGLFVVWVLFNRGHSVERGEGGRGCWEER